MTDARKSLHTLSLYFFLLRLFGTFILRGQFMFTFGSSLSVCCIKIAAIYACSHYDGVVLQIFISCSTCFMFKLLVTDIPFDRITVRITCFRWFHWLNIRICWWYRITSRHTKSKYTHESVRNWALARDLMPTLEHGFD